METTEEGKDYIQQRLDSLNEIDSNIVSLLGKMSDIFDIYSKGITSANASANRGAIENQTKAIYSTISDIAINLRKEVKLMDDNIGVFDKNEDSVMILPIPVDQKNTALGRRRIRQEIEKLETLIPEDPSEEHKFKPPPTVKDTEVKKEVKQEVKQEVESVEEIKDVEVEEIKDEKLDLNDGVPDLMEIESSDLDTPLQSIKKDDVDMN